MFATQSFDKVRDPPGTGGVFTTTRGERFTGNRMERTIDQCVTIDEEQAGTWDGVGHAVQAREVRAAGPLKAPKAEHEARGESLVSSSPRACSHRTAKGRAS
jgi:hypothetical protein